MDSDFDNECDVDFSDYAVFGLYWLRSDCAGPGWCGGADFNQSQKVDTEDLAVLIGHWLSGEVF